MEHRRYALALKEIGQWLADNPQSSEGHRTLATCLSKLKRHAEATEAAERAVQLDPESPFSYWAWASVLADRNRPVEALEAIYEALRIDPTDADYFAFAAQQRYRLGQ